MLRQGPGPPLGTEEGGAEAQLGKNDRHPKIIAVQAAPCALHPHHQSAEEEEEEELLDRLQEHIEAGTDIKN